MAKTKSKKTPMSSEHKKALAAGREEGRAVRHYLEALDANKPRRGRRRTKDSIKRRLDTIERELGDAAPVQRLQLVQERLDLGAELERMSQGTDITELEQAFSKVAKSYSERKGISYGAWREIGVPPEVLRRAGIARTRG